MLAALKAAPRVLAAFVLATALTHYYAFCLLGAFLAILALVDPRRRGTILIGGLGGALLAAPWLARVYFYAHDRLSSPGPGAGADGTAAGTLSILGRRVTRCSWRVRWWVLRPCSYGRSARVTGSGRPGPRYPGCLWGLAVAGLLLVPSIGPFDAEHAADVLSCPRPCWPRQHSGCCAGPRPSLRSLQPSSCGESGGTREIVTPRTVLAAPGDVIALRWIEGLHAGQRLPDRRRALDRYLAWGRRRLLDRTVHRAEHRPAADHVWPGATARGGAT